MLLQWNIFLFVFFAYKQESSAWNFKEASSWPEKYPECGGNNQSPIDITFELLDTMKNGPGEIQFSGLDDVPKSATLNNNGHRLLITPEWDGSPPTLSGGPLLGTYNLEVIGVRWPNEHPINGKSDPLAVHLVYHNKMYQSYEQALGHKDSVAEVIYRFRIGSESEVFNKILENADNVLSSPGTETSISPFSIMEFKPSSRNNQYFTYEGSFTVPPCPGPVTWIFSTSIYEISEDQMNKILSTKLIDGDENNARPVQPMGDRQLTAYNANF